jgi:regulatory protein
MRITEITPVPYHPDRVRVQLTGNRRPLTLTRVVAEDAGLRPGQWLDDQDLARLQDRDLFQVALDRALRFLESRPRSEREVRTRLAQKGVAPELAEPVVARLQALGLLDDAAFASYWIENRARFNPRGARALSAELRQKGVASEVIGEQLAEGVDEEGGAQAFALRQAHRFAKLDRPTFRQKLWAALARRGFDFAVIGPAVDAAWDALQSDPSDPDVAPPPDDG